ncbi:hypothetical protein ACFCXV_39065, partial [Streptomyces sp. NPDC056300]
VGRDGADLSDDDAAELHLRVGVVTEDIIRSLTISQRGLGTRSVVLIHHTGCGLLQLTEEFRHELELEVGQKPSWAVESFTDLEQGHEAFFSVKLPVVVSPFLSFTVVTTGW